MNKVSRRKKQTSPFLPPSVHPLYPPLPRVSFSPVERFIRSLGGLSIQVLATIFQKKSKGRLGNLGEPPSPLDRRLYSAQTCVRKCTRVRAAYVARYTRDTYTWSPRTSGIPGLDSRRRALRGRIYRVSPMRAQAAKTDSFDFPGCRGSTISDEFCAVCACALVITISGSLFQKREVRNGGNRR